MYFLRPVIIDLEAFGLQRLEVANLRLGLKQHLFPGRQLVARRNPDHIAILAHVQTLGLKNDVERLVPGHILQAQGEVALHRIAGDDIEVGEVRNHLQHGTDIDVLEVERELLATKLARPQALHQTVGIFHHLAHFEHELAVTLIGIVLPHARRRDHQPYIFGRRLRTHGGNRRTEVSHIGASLQVIRQAGIDELNHQIATLRPDVDPGLGIGQLDHDPAFPILAATEGDVLNALYAQSRVGCTRGGKGRGRLGHTGR